MNGELSNGELRQRVANYVRENYCFCFEYGCASCIMSKLLGTIEVDEILSPIIVCMAGKEIYDPYKD